ncbi:MAG: alpha/beta hydrolase [Salinarimonadaceae bacterium]|nr:MAG: alpha/beta hydrolase [Salinarimonadaceae bacterium]
MPQFIEVGKGREARNIAVEYREGRWPCLVWLGGFRSDMQGTKAEAVDGFAEKNRHACLRFDYSGHGESGGEFVEGTISRWRDEALAVIERFAGERPVLIGSSMGAWITLLATKALRESDSAHAPSALVLIAPAPDFTQALMWPEFDEAARAEIMEKGVVMRPSLYDDEGYPITRALIEDGARNLVMGGPIDTGCPVHILQGMEDPDVPWRHALALMELMPGEGVAMTLVRDGDHRLSRSEDIARLLMILKGLGAG